MESEEIFEISDFTVATEWEELMSRIEACLLDWDICDLKSDEAFRHLPKTALSTGKWSLRRESIAFAGLSFHLFHHKLLLQPAEEGTARKDAAEVKLDHLSPALMDLVHVSEPFPSGEHPLGNWFGFREFLVLSPASAADQIFNESQRNMLNSALTVAAANTHCELPLFLVCREPSEGIFFGQCGNRNARASLSTLRLARHHPAATHLAGLLALFKEHVGCAVPSVRVGVQRRFRLEEPLLCEASLRRLSEALPPIDGLVSPAAARLPFGLFRDPLRWVELVVSWPLMAEEMVVENDVYTDIDPLTAPFWRLRAAFSAGDQCLLHELAKGWVELARNRTPIATLLGLDEDAAPAGAFGSLTQAPASRLVAKSTAALGRGGESERRLPLGEADLNAWVARVFASETAGPKPDSPLKRLHSVEVRRAEASPGPGTARAQGRRAESTEEPPAKVPPSELLDRLAADMESAKTAPPDSLTERLVFALCTLLGSQEGQTAACQFWLEFVRTAEYFYDSGKLLPGLPESDQPDHGDCLLHQKLQLLQACILAKRRRKAQTAAAAAASRPDDDEFFDAEEEIGEDEAAEEERKQVSQGTPVGRMKPLGEGLNLINRWDHPDRPIFVPVTQDPSPMTEDMVEAETARLMALGASSESAGLRAKAQAQALLSDMQAFKAANPGCEMADFVRWHSPRDWLHRPEKPNEGTLSPRMTEGIWPETWAEATPVPVHRQPRLFNDGKEAITILRWLSGLSVGDLAELCLPLVASLALGQLVEESLDVYALIGDKLLSAARKISAASRARDLDLYRDVLKDVAWVETTEAQFRALKGRLPGVKDEESGPFIRSLMSCGGEAGGGVAIPGARNSGLGKAVLALFGDEEGPALPKPSAQEYLLKALAPRPGPGSRPCPQRLYARVSKDPREMRIAAAFTEDLTFF